MARLVAAPAPPPHTFAGSFSRRVPKPGKTISRAAARAPRKNAPVGPRPNPDRRPCPPATILRRGSAAGTTGRVASIRIDSVPPGPRNFFGISRGDQTGIRAPEMEAALDQHRRARGRLGGRRAGEILAGSVLALARRD